MSKQAHLCKALDQQILISRCRRFQPKVSAITWGDLGLHELETEKSAPARPCHSGGEVIVVDRKRAARDKQRSHKLAKD